MSYKHLFVHVLYVFSCDQNFCKPDRNTSEYIMFLYAEYKHVKSMVRRNFISVVRGYFRKLLVSIILFVGKR